MEEAEKFNIPLDSPLDVHHSDMLVSASQPTFMHNRQKFQGKVLPSSLRYEHDGWAAGWDVYQFKFNEAQVATVPAGLFVKRYLLDENNGQYVLSIVKDNQEVAQLYYNNLSKLIGSSGYNVSNNADTTIINGIFNGEQFEIGLKVLPYNSTIQYITSVLDLSVEIITDTNGYSTIILKDNTHKFEVNINDFVKGSNVLDSNDEVVAVYSGFSNNVHTWKSVGATITFNEVSQKLFVNDEEVSVSSNKAELLFKFYQKINVPVMVSFVTDKYYPVLRNVSFEKMTDTVSGASQSYLFNTWDIIDNNPNYLYSGNKVDINGWLPVWIGLRINCSSNGSSCSFSAYCFEHHKEIHANVNVGPVHYVTVGSGSSAYSIPESQTATVTAGGWLSGLVATATYYFQSGKLEVFVGGSRSYSNEVLYTSATGNSSYYSWAQCLKGYYSIKMTMQDRLTDSNVSNNINFVTSEFQYPNKFYIDRDGGNNRKLVHIKKPYDIFMLTDVMSYGQIEFEPESDVYFFEDYSADGTEKQFYIPGHMFTGNINQMSSKLGNMQVVSKVNIAFKVKFDTVTCTYVTQCNPYWGNITESNKYTEIIQQWAQSGIQAVINEPTIIVTGNDNIVAWQDINVSSGDLSFTIKANCLDKSIEVVSSQVRIYDIVATLNVGDNSSLSSVAELNLVLNILHDCHCSRTFTEEATLISYEKDVAQIQIFGNNITFDLARMMATYKDEAYPIEYINGYYQTKFTSIPKLEINSVLKGVFDENEIFVVSYNGNNIVFNYNGTNYLVDVIQLFASSQKETMDFYYTDTRDKDLKEVLFASREISSEFQFLKQQWSTTVEIENFWWIDKNHILYLTKSEFQLKQKTDELHDWDADVWKIIQTWKRDSILGAETYTYGVSNVYGRAYAYLWKVTIENGLLVVTFYNPLFNMLSYKMNIEKCKRELGTKLNNYKGTSVLGRINTYSDLLLTTLASMAIFTVTSLEGGDIVVGIHFDKNYNQWAIIFNVDLGIKNIIQGYGYVGANGVLTGGELPSKYFSVNEGFTGIVDDIKVFAKQNGKTIIENNIADVSELYTVKDRIVGNDAQQWYITKNITGIISHLDYVNGSYVARELPLNNNYDCIYASPSFSTRTVSDFIPSIKSVIDLFPAFGDSTISTLLKVILEVIGIPFLYIYHLRYNIMQYLQQTIGQYAYVHYNSTNKPVKDTTEQNDSNNTEKTAGEIGRSDHDYKNDVIVKAVGEDELSFNQQIIKQHAKSEDNPWYLLPGIIMQFFVSALEWTSDKLQINAKNNATDTSESGRKFSQIFLSNSDILGMTTFNIQGIIPSIMSGVSAIKTLDMFYSTADNQHVYAGPGYVAHNFVAQCVAQSVTSVQYELSQTSMFYIIKMLTLFQLQLEIELTNSIIKFLREQEETWSNRDAVSIYGSDTGDAIYKFVATAFGAAAQLLEKRITLQEIIRENLDELINIFNGEKITVQCTAKASKHSYDMEGKHKYGSKSECFMYPCFNCEDNKTIEDEFVTAAVNNIAWDIKIPISSTGLFGIPIYATLQNQNIDFTTHVVSEEATMYWNGKIPYFVANCYGNSRTKQLPKDTAYVIGTESFLPKEIFRNENISESDPVFSVPVIQDYVIDKSWQLGQTCIGENGVFWLSCKDTKLIDCPPSNIIITQDFCGVACPYTALEIKRGISRKYLRPWAITPQALALNNTGFNSCYEEKAYHAFDGYGYRLVNWLGSSGMNKEYQNWQYSFLINDRFKRSNKMDCNQFMGNFKSEPIVAIKGDTNDRVFSLVTKPSENKGLISGTAEEDKDIIRYSLPVFTEFVNTLPAAVKTISSYELATVEGITGLVSELRNGQASYKVPVSADFVIGKNIYRVTSEYICSVTNENGLVILQELVPILGLTYLGSTPYEAYFYSQATRQYYKYTGGTSINVIDMIERFRNVVCGRYDFVNQEVVVPCIATFDRLDKEVRDDEDETDNIIVPRVKESMMIGEIQPPIKNIFNTRSWYRTISLPCGVTYQGPNRCIINRFIYSDYMQKSIIDNYGNWKRVPREDYHPFRKYKAEYEQVDKDIGDTLKIKGWTHNQFLLVTSPIGTLSEHDNLYEWEVTFAWTVEMDKLYAQNNYATVNIMAETMTPGGKVTCRPTHVYLYKELFTRTGNYGYYSFRFQSKCGSGNRERLHIWSDQYIAISSLQCEIKQITNKRSEILTQQIDVQDLNEI